MKRTFLALSMLATMCLSAVAATASVSGDMSFAAPEFRMFATVNDPAPPDAVATADAFAAVLVNPTELAHAGEDEERSAGTAQGKLSYTVSIDRLAVAAPFEVGWAEPRHVI